MKVFYLIVSLVFTAGSFCQIPLDAPGGSGSAAQVGLAAQTQPALEAPGSGPAASVGLAAQTQSALEAQDGSVDSIVDEAAASDNSLPKVTQHGPGSRAKEKSGPTYKADTCVWSTDLPRRVISQRGCTQGAKTQACVGYVVCEQQDGDLKFVRMSTCSAKNCNEDKAVACTKERGFSSSGADTVSEPIMKILKENQTSRE
jgi:hypothetical protein